MKNLSSVTSKAQIFWVMGKDFGKDEKKLRNLNIGN